MPTAKFNWLNRGIVTLYSKVATGIYIGSVSDCKVNDLDKDKTSVGFAFQASPIGIELGKQFAFFAEAGLGNTGTVMAGFRVKFQN